VGSLLRTPLLAKPAKKMGLLEEWICWKNGFAERMDLLEKWIFWKMDLLEK
jgi:hypothetical protein